MDVVLVSTYAQSVALGLRYISAYLKRAGHKVTIVFMASKRETAEVDYSPPLLADFVHHCRSADVIGMSLMTNTYYRAKALTEALRAGGVQAPIVWGGTHATVAPRESAEVADYVCIGEGEKAMVDFAAALDGGGDPAATANLAHLKNGDLHTNKPYPLADDLNEYPFPDYDLEDHWITEKDALVPVADHPKLLRGALRRYRILSTRGCPFSCSFCNNATQMRIYREAGSMQNWVRKRSVESIVGELESICARYPSIKEVNIVDDLFLVRSEDEVDAFVEAYRRRINLPIELDAFPSTVSQAKVASLSRLPLKLISMGIQSGSRDTLFTMYNRPTPVEMVARAIRIISDQGLRAEYHYLVANPFETEESMVETLRFAADHHRGPAKLRIFPLQLFPGSAMHERARKEGVIDEHHDDAYRGSYAGKKHIMRAHYLEIWLRIVLGLRNAGVPQRMVHKVIDFALSRPGRWLLDRSWFPPASFYVYRVSRVLFKNLLYRPVIAPIMSRRQRRDRRRREASVKALGQPA
ncbi:MAG: B12-binding domain-containing radical SAM protein [Phycisphaerales bacterium]|nr:MAG: B12-binding domain-containing radical SAM protein [Phycisphaerales bacterium]